MKRISIKGLADFMAANDAKRRTIIRRFKYPREDEAFAMIKYYQEARDAIAAHHSGGHDAAWLHRLGDQLDAFAASVTGQTTTRIRHNARAIHAYATTFADRRFEVLAVPKLRLSYSGVTISVVPDLRVRENSDEKIIKLEFGKDQPAEREIKVMSQVLFEAARVGGLQIPARSVLYLDVSRGTEHRGARLGAQLARDLEAACETISDIWDRI
jgi:hypothetical protein